MSAYVVQPETIARIIGWYCDDRVLTAEGWQRVGIRSYLADHGLDPLVNPGQYKLFSLMYAMNVKAVCQRYPKKVTPEMFPIPDQVPQNVPTPSIVQAYKTIECYLYQCSEGTVENSKLYRLIQWTQERTGAAIIHRLPEYEAAEWG